MCGFSGTCRSFFVQLSSTITILRAAESAAKCGRALRKLTRRDIHDRNYLLADELMRAKEACDYASVWRLSRSLAGGMRPKKRSKNTPHFNGDMM